MRTSRSGASGKIVTNRRKQRLAATPYDRPPPQPSPPPPSKSPNWFSSIIVPSARALASGAGKILSSIFSESESSYSEDEDFASEDDIDNYNHHEIQHDGVSFLNEANATASEMMQCGQEPRLMWTRETKRIFEQLILKETFSRDECDRLKRLLNSRVMDWSMAAGEKSFLAGSPGKTAEHEDIDKEIQEAKKWFQEKKVGPNSVMAQRECNLNSTVLEHVETGGGSPVDVARSYMKVRPPWASPGTNIELKTPLTATIKLFKEGTSYSVGNESSSTSKKRSSLASRSWNIQEELRRVSSRATEDMLRNSSTRTNLSFFGVQQTRAESVEADKRVSVIGQRMTERASVRLSKPVDTLVDAGVNSEPAIAAFGSRQVDKTSEERLSKPLASVSGTIEALEAVLGDAETLASKLNHVEEQHAEFCNVNCSPAAELAEVGGNESVTGLTPSQVSLSVQVTMGQNCEQHDDENSREDTSNEKPTKTTNVEGNCELLSEAYLEVPIVTETNSVASGSPNSLVEEQSLDAVEPSPKRKARVTARKQQVKRPTKFPRKSRVRSK